MAASVVAPRRVTIAAPSARVDVSLPPQAIIAELLPQLTGMLGAKGGGWALQRFAAPPIDDTATVAGAGLRDGEVLYLSRRDQAAPPPLFDDVVDAIASASADPRLIWRPHHTRRLALIGVLVGSAGLTALAQSGVWQSGAGQSGVGQTPPVLLCGALAVVLLLVATALARAFGDSGAGAVVALAGLPAAFLGGLSLLGGVDVAVGFAVVVGYASVAAAGVADRAEWFACAVVAAGTGCVAVAATLAAGFSPAVVAAICAVAGVVLCPAMAPIALRLARIPPPVVPVDAAGFRSDDRTPAGPQVAAVAAAAGRALAGLLAGLALVVIGSAWVLLDAATMWGRLLALLAGLALVLRARAYIGIAQRTVLLLGGAVVLTLSAVDLGATASTQTRAGLVLALVVVGAVCVVQVVRAPGHTPSALVARLLDIADVAIVVALVPVAAAVADLYAVVRSLGG